MIEPKDPFTYSASAMGEADDRLFEQMFDALYRNDLRSATTQELAFVLGVAVGTIKRLRKHIEQLENKQ